MVKVVAILGSSEGVTGTISFINEGDGAPTTVTENLAGLKLAFTDSMFTPLATPPMDACPLNSTLMLIAYTAGFVLQWRLALVLISVFPVIIAATVLHKMFMKGFSDDLEVAHARATQIAGEVMENVRKVAAFNYEGRITELFAANLKSSLRGAYGRARLLAAGSVSPSSSSMPPTPSTSGTRPGSSVQSTTSFWPGDSRSRPASG